MGKARASRHDVARLFGRAAFGATAEDLDRWTGQPYAEVVSFLLDFPPVSQRVPAPDEAERISLEQGTAAEGGLMLLYPLQQAQDWWLERMRTTRYPLEERMTLFWHDHFATAPNDKGTSIGTMLAQNQLLREHGLGSFRELCERITVDPAMLFWLDGAYNASYAPNENYAREFFELFTLGTIPQVYTEKDIRASARALTGWTADYFTRVVVFYNEAHDQGKKVVLGRTIKNLGDQEYKAIVDVALDQKVSPFFVAYKMVQNFAWPPATRDLLRSPGPLISRIGDTLRRTKWNLREAMRTMLLADEFRYAEARKERQVVRQPVELVVHACKAIGISARDVAATAILNRMGQNVFVPPNVGGWPFGRNWLSPATFLARYDWGILAHQLHTNGLLKDPLPDPKDLGAWKARFGLSAINRNTEAAIRSYLHARRKAPVEERQSGMVALVVSSPDWMVM